MGTRSTRKLRERISSALRTRRFISYLFAVHPFDPLRVVGFVIAAFLTKKLGSGALQATQFVLTLAFFVVLAAVDATRIWILWKRFCSKVDRVKK